VAPASSVVNVRVTIGPALLVLTSRTTRSPS